MSSRVIADSWSGEPHLIIIDDLQLFGSTHAEDWVLTPAHLITRTSLVWQSAVTNESILEVLGAEKVHRSLTSCLGSY